MKRFKTFINRFFKQKKNLFITILAFFVVAITSVSINSSYSKLIEIDTVASSFPDELSIASFTYDNYYKNIDSFSKINAVTVFKKTIYLEESKSSFSTNDKYNPSICVYGVDNSFLKNKIINEGSSDYFDFNTFELNGRNYFTDVEVDSGCKNVIVSDKLLTCVDSNKTLKFNGNVFCTIGCITFDLPQKKDSFYSIFMTKKAFSDLYGMAKSEVFVYSVNGNNKIKEMSYSKYLDKNIINTKVNNEIKENQANTFLYLMLFATSIISLIIVTFISIRNKLNEIGIKLAVGAQKIDIILELINEISFGLGLGILSGLFCGTLISIFIQSIQTVMCGVFCIGLNLPMISVISCAFYLLCILFSLIPLLIIVNSNIEMVLKEER